MTILTLCPTQIFCNHGSTAADLKVVAPLVFLHSIVVGEFHDKVVVLGSKTDHGFTPKSIVRATVRQIMHNVITLYQKWTIQ